MKKLLLISLLIGAMPFSMVAQDDDLYFVPKKKSAEKVVDNYGLPRDTYYSGSDRSVDDYNRRWKSSYEVIEGDSTLTDVIDFSAEQGVYPDSLSEDFELTKEMSRFDDYRLADNAAFWAGYEAGRDSWGWYSPWYYGRYGWYGGWYDPWYDPWYSPYYYSSWRYGWYDPWYYGYYGWRYPYYWGGYYIHPIGGGGRHYAHIGSGTIRRNGSTSNYYHGGGVAGSGRRVSSLRERAARMSTGSGSYSGRSGNRVRSGSGNFSGYRGGTSNSNSGFSGTRSSGSFGGAGSSGGFSGGSRGGSGGGGGSRMGGRR